MHIVSAHSEASVRYINDKINDRYRCIEEKVGQDVVDYISTQVDLADPGVEVFFTAEPFNVEINSFTLTHGFVNLKRINDIAEPNEIISLANDKLPQGGFFIGCVETLGSRRDRILNKYPRLLAYPVYFLDFIIKRIFPKMGLTRKIYRLLTRDMNRVMSLTETLGRLVLCGFEVTDYRAIGYLTYFVCRKVKAPLAVTSQKYGLVIGLERVGMGGKLFKVYKLRTMHPYAEYLQDYVYQKNSICDNGKFNGDFRVSSWGRILRKFWIDEQPMWLNWFKREMKLVGVRPLSEHYLRLYPKEFQQRRINYKPGLIPPFYCDLPKTLAEIVESERRYLDAYDRHPWITDFRYFWLAFYQILFKRARSS